MIPPQLANFFTCPPPLIAFFLDDPPTHTRTKKLTLPKDFTFLIFSIIPLLDVIVLNMKTKLTIPILQKALQSTRTQIKRKSSQTLLFLGHRSLIKNKKQTAVINILNLRIFWLRLDVYLVCYCPYIFKFKTANLIKHQLFPADIDIENWLKFLNKLSLFDFAMVVCKW